ncbi:hypothetical protein BGX26_004137 [Mortierella sp. AD094]|nr:hypothetical protein BGX26_004137 [Mortierella sp. AD094]
MSGPPTSAGLPDFSAGDIQMSSISNSNSSTTNTGYNINDHDYDGLLHGSSATSASTSTAIGAAVMSENSYSNSYGASSQETNYNNYADSNIGGGIGSNGTGVATHNSGLTRKVTLTGGSTGVSEVKLKRFLEHNNRLREQLEMRRVPVSEACHSLTQFVTTTRDPLLPIIWGVGPDPFAKQSSGCCNIS